MKSMQTRFEDEIDGIMAAAHLEPVISYNCSNVGSIYGMSITGHDTVVKIDFDFQASHATLVLNNEHFYFKYTESAEIRKFFEKLRAICRDDYKK